MANDALGKIVVKSASESASFQATPIFDLEQKREIEKLKHTIRTLQEEWQKEKNFLIAERARFEDIARGVAALRSWQLRHEFLNEPFSLKKIWNITRLLCEIITPSYFRTRHNHCRVRLWPRNRPLVSVIMPSFNYGRFIQEAIDSVLAQTCADFELLIIDCSTEVESIEKVVNIKHPKIRVYRREGVHLLGDNRNFGINHARGKYICSLDPDDRIEPTYLEKALFLLETKALEIVSPSLQEFGEQVDSWNVHPHPSLQEVIESNKITVAALFSKEYWKKANGFHDYGMGEQHVHEDWDFWVRMLALGARVRGLKEPLLLYRKHSSSMSADKRIPPLSLQRERILKFNEKFLAPENVAKYALRQRQEFVVVDGDRNLFRTAISKRSLKSIFIALPYLVVGGVTKRFLDICAYLKEQEYQITILTTVSIEEGHVDITKAFRSITEDVFQFPLFLESIEEYRSFLSYLIKSRSPEVLLIAGSDFVVQELPSIKEIAPTIKVIDSLFNTEGHLKINRAFADFIDVTVVENDSIIDEMSSLWDADTSKISLIENGVDTKEFQVPLKSSNTNDSFTVSFIGRLSFEKGPDRFIEIAKECLKINHTIKFILAGPGLMEEQMRARVRQLDLEEYISLPGNVSSKEYLAKTDILIVPSRYDGRPNIILEAFSMGVPVIASAVGGIPKLIEESKAGVLCEAQNIAAFAEAIVEISSNKERLKLLRENARQYAETSLDLKISNEKLLNLMTCAS